MRDHFTSEELAAIAKAERAGRVTRVPVGDWPDCNRDEARAWRSKNEERRSRRLAQTCVAKRSVL